jgi:hypothetical protein
MVPNAGFERITTIDQFSTRDMPAIISQKKTRDGGRRVIKFLDDRPIRFEKFVCSGEEESWVCSRKPFDEEPGRECRGRARCKTGGGVLKTCIPHDNWCRPKPYDEEVRVLWPDRFASFARSLAPPSP